MRRARPLLGTLVEVRAQGLAPERLRAAVDVAFAEVEAVHRLMSFHDSASDLAALNRNAYAAPVEVDPRTYEVFEAAQQMAAASNGAFDVTVGAYLQAWGLLPGDAEACEQGASWRDIELLERSRVRYRRRLRVDLGGIAKGYAVDRAIAILRAAGVAAGQVNAGGDLRVFGAHPSPIRLRSPADPANSMHGLLLRDEALATSALYYSRPHGCSWLVDPHSASAWNGESSVSVRAPACTLADALTKVVMFAEPAVSDRVLETYAACAYVQTALPGPEPSGTAAC
jgi:thiamine biosynthesis lipoprotein